MDILYVNQHIEKIYWWSLSCDLLFVSPWTAARQASLYFTISWSLLKLMSIDSVMPSNHLILCRPHLLLPSIFPSSRIFSNESVLRIRWPKYWNCSFNISPSNEYSGLISFRIDWLDHSIWSHHFMTNRWGSKGNSVRLFWGGPPKSLQMVTAATKLKDTCSLEESDDQPR